MKKRKFIIHFTAVILINAVATAGWYIMFNEVRGLTTAIKDAREKINQNDRLIEDQRSIATLLSEHEGGVSSINSAFVEKETIVSFVERIEELGRNTRNTVDISISSLDKSKEKPTFAFAITGAPNDIYRFISALQYVPYKIRITNAEMHEDTEEAWRGDINIILLSYL